MDLSIIINHYKSPAVLKLCLKYLFENLPLELSTEVFLADSETQKESQEIIKKYPKIKHLPFKNNVGFSKIVNKALKQANGKFVFIINADIIIDSKKAIPEMINYIKQNPKVGLIGPKLLNIDGSFQQSCFKYYTFLTLPCRRTCLKNTRICQKNLDKFLMREIDLKNTKKPLQVDWLMGSALLATKKAIQDVGLFDDRFFMYFEDVDWCKRFWQKNYQVVWFPNSLVYHYHFRASQNKSLIWAFLSKYTRIHIISAWKYFRKYGFRN